MRVVLEFIRKSTGSVIHIKAERLLGAPPFAFVKGFNGFEFRTEKQYWGTDWVKKLT